MPNLEPVIVPTGECRGCPHLQTAVGDEDFCEHSELPKGRTLMGLGGSRPAWCPLETQAAIRWVPEVVGEVKDE